jgi:hypothetical protein
MKLPKLSLPKIPPEFKQDKFFVWSARIGIVVQLFCFLLLLWKWAKLPQVVPLFYSLPWGDQQLGHPLSLLLLVCSISFFYVVNTLFALVIFNTSKYLSHMLLIATTIITILTAITLVNIVWLVSYYEFFTCSRGRFCHHLFCDTLSYFFGKTVWAG